MILFFLIYFVIKISSLNAEPYSIGELTGYLLGMIFAVIILLNNSILGMLAIKKKKCESIKFITPVAIILTMGFFVFIFIGMLNGANRYENSTVFASEVFIQLVCVFLIILDVRLVVKKMKGSTGVSENI